ncbi:GntR family transcriptional regulator [Nocardia takedensis]|uniref:GntR family transcriptional regulator n=1 Tax=Nocardia takedensis TaxID=259390 RepID=UPI0003164ACF|nr:GntR family transcriptional regulator [Nocardia takedensis]
MNPHLQRPEPVYLQLVTHYRDAITSGELAEGQRLPTVREIADYWKVAYTTAAKAVRQLAADGLVSTSKQGTIVAFLEGSTYSPADRLRSVHRGRVIYPHGASKIISAEVIEAPQHVADAMGLDAGDRVVRRERVTAHGDVPVTWSVTWMPAELVETVPELLDLAPIPGGQGTIGLVKERTGRFPKVGLDSYRQCAARATALIAERLGINEGDPILRGENSWPEESGVVLEFGEFAIPEGQWVTVS